jgi:hypothetical protein
MAAADTSVVQENAPCQSGALSLPLIRRFDSRWKYLSPRRRAAKALLPQSSLRAEILGDVWQTHINFHTCAVEKGTALSRAARSAEH